MQYRQVSAVGAVILGLGILGALNGTAQARPSYGNNCLNCHGSSGFGNDTPGAIFDLLSPNQSTIPNGAFGDPDRGEGPLPAYVATPGGSVTLDFIINDPSGFTPPFVPDRWAIAIKNIHHTDPDYQLGNLDPLTWRDDQLTLDGAQPGPDPNSPNPAPFPTSAADWSLYTGLGTGVQYYGSTPDRGHAWVGPFQFSLVIGIPAGVLPGWYDIEVSSSGWDYAQSLSFDDDAHFYLNVIPEPASSVILVAGVLLLRRGCTRSCRANKHLKAR